MSARSRRADPSLGPVRFLAVLDQLPSDKHLAAATVAESA
jgi:hypothetical protein